MIRILGTFGALLAAALALSACATTAQITDNNSNLCINVINHGSPVPGAPVILRPCDPFQNQQWAFSGNGPITGVGGFCVDVEGSMATDGARVIYTPCNGAPSQNWNARQGSIIGIGSKCLDVAGANMAPGTSLVINACNGSPTQQWVAH
jgi:hypothetical protein